jgi:flagellar operon protein
VSVELNPALLPPGAATPAQPTGTPAPARTGAGAAEPAGPAFADVLKDASASTGAAPLRFSKHAIERAQRRGIPLDPSTLSRLQEGVGRIAGKGSRDSLVLVDGNAFVVSVPNRTVITAVGSEHMREHVFTNIDSAVIA